MHPPKLLNRTLTDLHSTHLGMEKMQSQDREAVYWPGIDAAIIDYVRRLPTAMLHFSCPKLCTKFKATQPAQPMLPLDRPYGLWQEITADYFNHKSKDYHLFFDLFSKYSLLYSLPSPSPKKSRNSSPNMDPQESLHRQWPALHLRRI